MDTLVLIMSTVKELHLGVRVYIQATMHFCPSVVVCSVDDATAPGYARPLTLLNPVSCHTCRT